MIYTSLVALAQTDMKKLIAYSSVAHMGFVTMGIFAVTSEAVQGAMIQMLSHGLVSAALFLCVGVVYDRLHTRDIARYGGLADNMPAYAFVFMVFMLASVGLPGTSGFVGEFLIAARHVPGQHARVASSPRPACSSAPPTCSTSIAGSSSARSRATMCARMLDLTLREKVVFAPLIAARAVDGHLSRPRS